MTNLAVIPARGGSKRIPRKNIKSFLGKPIIAYSIETALNSNLFNEVMVSTDDDEIAEVAKQYGAKVPFLRSKKNSDDFATTFDVIKEIIEFYKREGKIIKRACCIYPTAPFVTSEILNQASNLLDNNNFDCVFPVLPFSFPIQRAVRKNSFGKMTMFYPEHQSSRSQDLEKAFHDAGQFYFFKPETIIKKQVLWTDNTGVIEIDELKGQDIDTLMDWKLAELKYKLLVDNETNF
ncbi:pseudaminic acid cytidylyltransferase [Winogradskyella sp.]|jgi:N-acylneuraminate cytidylyltransferase|uniref:pseudaminic acid cytidylyltransferase n=1 Tax=Winogradskyella sp. TaxID=1883156 RepID=UPI0025D3E904|nr:pseudaminic acid cytidylyltransferase [Winogradskyella sp.]MCT4628556.1 pseudaminic acid cytidylyltransferase [Winogradskyella sp.]